jgi:type I restriction enzyme, S subunit
MKEKFLRELADIQTGPFGSQLHKEDYVADGTPIVTVEHLGNKMFSEQNLPRVSNTDKNRLKKYVLKQGDIVFSRVGSVDRCSYVDQKHDGWMFSGRCLRVRPTSEIDSEYLYYYFCLEETKQFVRNIAVGATMPSINTKLLGEVVVTFPELEQQKRISGILSAIDSKIEVNQKINDNLYDLVNTLYTKLFKDTDCEMTTVEDYVDCIYSGGTPATSNMAYWNGNLNWLSSGETRNRFVISTEKTITQLGADNSSTKSAQKYDIVIASAGQGFTRGQTSMLLLNTYINQSVIVLHAKKTVLPYLFWNLTNRYDDLRAISDSSSIRGSLTTKMLSKLKIPKVEDSLILKFSEYAWSIIPQIENNLIENKRLTDLRDSLLPKLMSGEIDVSDIQL